ncbi:restriction endonuclease subunit S [Escherichia coli]|uniref:Restriction endonuclease subunit S n=1 Tax=Escherichia coli TaxID=562 RepID=A0A8T5Z564_ECOLX|nr:MULTISPECIES: restriction endonuclease subunit S [Enterobacteriaceae]HDG1706309.1 restriction endonuclease subunit S [Kluyvera ascorbata]EFG8163782.1 restriction endonuclease subunit S [Escherichia coli]EJZ0217863.1 restriction endonuclease subunit S [Escherichia coli]ELL4022565.1 restriction endonuclease subunit S [Escherichia coli]ELL4036410.1 restriction endonuclease subunit S [Escherichia coli]
MVPKGWELSSIGKISDVSSGGTPSRNNEAYWNGNIPWVTTAEVQFKIIEDTVEKITEEGLANSSAKLFPAGTILMAMYGQGKTRGQVAKLGIDASTNQACAAIVLHTGYEVDFYYQFLISQYENIREMANSGGQQNLSGGIVKSIPVPVPPLTEQKKIAKILSTWDNAISVTEKLLTNSQQQKKALMQQLLTGKKRLLDENGVRFSGEWEYTIFGNLGDTYTGLTGKTKEDFGAGKPYIPYINIFKNSRIDIQNLEYVQVNDDERQSVVKYGDIFFTTSSETPEEVGMSSVLLEEVSEVFLNSFCFGFRLNNFETLIPKYARYLFRSEHVRRQISTLGQGATRYNLSKRQLIKLELKLPCVEEQQKIAAVLSAADAEISTLEKKLACLKDEKKALMQQLLTGKRRVKVDEAVAV